MHPRTTYSDREIMFLAAQEKAVHIDDILLRRLLLAMLGLVDGEVLRQVGEAMAGMLGWSREQTQQEIVRVADLLQREYGVPEERLRHGL